MAITPKEIIEFWYSDRIKRHWFAATPALDNEILENYESLWETAASGELDAWATHPDGCLALVILLDQFPLHLFRGQAKSFQTERKAVAIARKAIENQWDQRIEKDKLPFLYMPFMHSEWLAEQEMAVTLYRENHLDANLRYAEHHRDLIKRFGRFPHRNKILGRESTVEEIR